MNRTKMLSKATLIAVILAAILCFLSTGLVGCTTPDREVTTPLPPLTPPDPQPKVHSVVITYNDTAVNRQLAVDLSLRTIRVNATVTKDEGAIGTLSFDSSDKRVATIDGDGNITFAAAGDTVITARYGSESAQILLTVESGTVNRYTVTVVDGKASATTATAGEIITLTAIKPVHKDFSEWIYTDSETPVTWVSGNMFKMPEGNVTVKAGFVDTLYTLKLVGARVSDDGNYEVQKGVLTGFDSKETENAETAVYEYKYAYGTKLTIDAVEPTSTNRMFVGWDRNTVNNRIDSEMTLDNFEMPDETVTYFANYSDISTKKLFEPTVYIPGTGDVSIDNASPEYKKFGNFPVDAIDGTAINSDPVFEGFSGYTVTIPGGTTGTSDFPENIRGSVLDASRQSQAVRAIFRNRGDKPVTVEIYASQVTNIATSGAVTVPAGGVVTKTFVAMLGLNKPWWGFSVRENVGSGADIPLDMVVGCADAYPKGDRTLSVTSGTRLAKIAGDGRWWTQYGSNPPGFSVNNDYAWTQVSQYENQTSGKYVVTAQFDSSMFPEYDPEDPYLTIYIRFVNRASSDHAYTYRVFLSETDHPIKYIGDNQNDPDLDDNGLYQMREDIPIAYTDITVSTHGQTELVALRVPHAADKAWYNFNIGIIKMGYSASDGTAGDNSYAANFSMIMTYNNGIGFDGDIVGVANTEANI